MGILDSLLRPNIDKLREKRDIQGLIKALSNKDKKIRRKAIASLRESGMLTMTSDVNSRHQTFHAASCPA